MCTLNTVEVGFLGARIHGSKDVLICKDRSDITSCVELRTKISRLRGRVPVRTLQEDDADNAYGKFEHCDGLPSNVFCLDCINGIHKAVGITGP
jgi:hypothetical protein